MQDTPSSGSSTRGGPCSSRNLAQTALLATAVLLVPAALGLLVVLLSHTLRPAATPPPADALAGVTNSLYDGTALDKAQLLDLHAKLRSQGVATDDVNLRLWAASAAEPTVLFSVPPPESGKKWHWSLSHDGLYAVAVSSQRDALERRTVGLFDLLDEKWLWTKVLPWPETHETPYVFNRHLVLRYAKNATRFALEIDGQGTILNIDTLGKGALAPAPTPPPNPLFPGSPVAIKSGVFFASDPADDTLKGYALEALPGLRYVGKGDAHTAFSGNGLLKFNVGQGRVTVYDSLTQTVLQQIDAWPHTTNTVVTGTLSTHDGSRFTVFLKTDLGGTPPVTREWSVAIALYAGTVVRSFNADALFAKPKSGDSLQSVSPDTLWQLSVTPTNVLTVVALPSRQEVARVPLARLGLRHPLSNLAFLEEGRQAALRQNDNLWLLDFTVARGYGDQLSRAAHCTNAVPQPELPTNLLADASAEDASATQLPPDSDALTFGNPRNETAPSYLAMRAELFGANQAWGYAAALLEKTRQLQEYDSRAPRVNPLMLARYQLLSGQAGKARTTCRDALRTLIADTTDYNRMIRYHLQGLLFAKP